MATRSFAFYTMWQFEELTVSLEWYNSALAFYEEE